MDLDSEHQLDTNSDRQPDSAPSRRLNQRPNRRRWLVLALALVLGGAFTVSATSTWLLGERHHLDELARSALILMLEVGSVTGAAIYVITKRAGTRTRAGLVVAIATGVGATGGVQAYGFLIGLPVAALLLLLVDLIAVFWHESTSTFGAADTDDAIDRGRPSGGLSQLVTWWTAQRPAVGPAGELAASTTSTTPGPDSADDEPAPLPVVRGVEPAIVAQVAELLERERRAGRMVGRPRLVRDFGLTDWRAGLVLDALRPLRAVGGEAS